MGATAWRLIKLYDDILVIAGLLIGYLLFLQYQAWQAQALIHELRKSDFVFIDYQAIDPESDKRFRYIPMKVLNSGEEHITFKVGNIAFTKPVSPRTHMQFDRPLLLRNFYRDGTITLATEKIVDWFEQGIIYDVRRPNSIYIDGWIVIPERERYFDDPIQQSAST